MAKWRMLMLVEVWFCIDYVQAKLQSDVRRWIYSGTGGNAATFTSDRIGWLFLECPSGLSPTSAVISGWIFGSDGDPADKYVRNMQKMASSRATVEVGSQKVRLHTGIWCVAICNVCHTWRGFTNTSPERVVYIHELHGNHSHARSFRPENHGFHEMMYALEYEVWSSLHGLIKVEVWLVCFIEVNLQWTGANMDFTLSLQYQLLVNNNVILYCILCHGDFVWDSCVDFFSSLPSVVHGSILFRCLDSPNRTSWSL